MCLRMRIQVVVFLLCFKIAGAELPNDIDELPINNITLTDEIFSVFIDGIPSISASEYTLSVTGMVDRPLTLTLEQVRGFRRAVVMSTLECLGNRAVPGLIANATWTGVPLRTVLDMAGVWEKEPRE